MSQIRNSMWSRAKVLQQTKGLAVLAEGRNEDLAGIGGEGAIRAEMQRRGWDAGAGQGAQVFTRFTLRGEGTKKANAQRKLQDTLKAESYKTRKRK